MIIAAIRPVQIVGSSNIAKLIVVFLEVSDLRLTIHEIK